MADYKQPLPDIRQLEQSGTQLWFPIPPVLPTIARRHTFPTHAERVAAIKVFMSSVLHDFTTPTIMAFDESFCNQLSPDTWPQDCVMPSNGYLITKSILESDKYVLHDKLALGFTWEGWTGHPWQHEKQYFFQKTDSHELSII